MSGYPKLEGRFPQVSGLRFTFDASLEPGSRVVPGSVVMQDGSELDPDKEYMVASMEFITKGKDGYDAFTEGRVVKDGELLPMLPSLMRNHLKLMQYASMLQTPRLNTWRSVPSALVHVVAAACMRGCRDDRGLELCDTPHAAAVRTAGAAAWPWHCSRAT